MATLGCGIMLSSIGCQNGTASQTDPVVTKKIASLPPSLAQPPAANATLSEDSAPTAKTPPAESPYQVGRLPYDPSGKLDPFKPLFKEDPKPKKDLPSGDKKPERPRTPLERLDLGQLRLTAVVISEVRPRAMVEEDSGKGYVVEIGTPIGLERGQVTAIQRDRLVIEHLKTDDFGNAATRRRELKLQKPLGD